MADSNTRTRIKICGVTRPADARWLAKYPIAYVGLNFHPASPRYVSVASARAIIAELPSSIPAIGVFVDRPPAEVSAIVEEVGLHGAQLHGAESATEASLLYSPLVIKAFKVRDESARAVVDDFAHAWTSPRDGQQRYCLLDAYHPKEAGGTGARWDWGLVGNWRPALPWFLAGGLKPANIFEAVTFFRPVGVDLASGVESAPGIKDERLVRQLVDEVQRADLSSS